MARTDTKVWAPAEYLGAEEAMAAYLGAALDEGRPAPAAAALGDVSRTWGMTRVVRGAGLGRASLCKALPRQVARGCGKASRRARKKRAGEPAR